MYSTQTKAFGVFISHYLSTGNNVRLFHIVKGESYNTVSIGYSDGYSISSTEFSCLSDGIQFTKKGSVNANDKVIIPYGTNLINLPKLPINASDVNIYGQSLEEWADQQIEIITHTAIEKSDEKTQDLKNILSPAIDDLKYNVSATKNIGYRKVAGVGNIKVEITLEITYINPGKNFNSNLIIYAQDMLIIVSNYRNLFYTSNSVAYGKGMFVAVGEAGTVNIFKPSSTSWENFNFSTSLLKGVVYENNQFVIVGDGGKIITNIPSSLKTDALISNWFRFNLVKIFGTASLNLPIR
jgi:hypothetical protein